MQKNQVIKVAEQLIFFLFYPEFLFPFNLFLRSYTLDTEETEEIFTPLGAPCIYLISNDHQWTIMNQRTK